MNPELPILVVDDARFSSAVVSRTLKQAGYTNLQVVNTAADALETLDRDPISILIADWLMPEMDGLELTDRVRQQDEQTNHYTYIILLTGKESVEALSKAFDRGVDDFIYKSDMTKQLLPRVFAADRLAERHNTLLHTNQLLMEENRQLEAHNVVDPETGLGNARYARQRLQQALDYTESRGGAVGYVLIGIRHWGRHCREQPAPVQNELLETLARRMTGLIRPLDALCRIGHDRYAVIAHFPDADHCRPAAFRRLHDGINHKALKTSRGFISVEADATLCIASEREVTPTADAMEAAVEEGLSNARQSRTLTRAQAAAPRSKPETG
ncbi:MULTISPECIES: GGDEF domain-containing response regulator [Gammaproteobacteria]|jgi:PleD family two-component response regulator|uniref:Response regulator n=1 Tax=Vreelandella halophila TaxID=86177 RepID=A0A9X5B4P9_9GAMM|nr:MULTISPECIES: response regulator [Gammaproteobacteria]KAA8985161.1 response regulator [Halospina sp. K52047b]MYL25588.1 response regulator [Halomonas utahensis]MYL74824.1 response regulator [Halomonas sp. 22501_18_FS]